jgi:hypothetical protein
VILLRIFALLLVGISSLFASELSPTNSNTASSILSTSPNDINQLLSLLKQENYSLISQTVFTPYIKKYEDQVEALQKSTGLNFGMSYIPLYEYSNAGMMTKTASGGGFDFFARYLPASLQGSKTVMGMKLSTNEAFSHIYPGNFSKQFNSKIRTVSGYLPLDPAVIELWVQQTILNDKMTYRLGKIDLTSMMNTYAFDSRRFYFLSNVFNSHPATAVPSKSLGAVIGVVLSKHFYTAAGIVNANGEISTSGFASLHQNDYYTALELGYRDIITSPQSDNYHVFLWHVDARNDRGIPSDQGLSVVLQKNFNSKIIPFIKYDWNQGRATEFKTLLISGFGLEHPFGGHFGLLGLAMGLVELSIYPGEHQTITEAFYRLQLTPYSQLTPDIYPPSLI